MASSRVAIGVACVMLLTAVGAAAEEKQKNQVPEKARAILEKADQLELFSLDPEADRDKTKEGFSGWKVLGKTVVKDAAVRKQILAALDKGIADSDGIGAKCFDPRDGIRATVGGKTVDLVICFECHWVYVYYDQDENRQAVLVTTRNPQATLDKVLKDAGVALPKPAK